MKYRWDLVALVIILTLLFWVRLEIANSTPSLSYDSYLTVRDVENIQHTGTPLYNDPLSLTGAKRVFNPIFDYLLAALTFSTDVYKFLPNLFMVLALIPVYFLTLRCTQSKPASYVAVILAGTGPIVFSSYLNTPSATPVAVFLLLSILAMVHDPDTHLFPIVILTIFLTFLSPLIFILVLSFLAMIVLLRVEGFGVDRRINELFFFTLVLAIWFYVIIYKQALFTQGIQVIWQNLPSDLASITFGNISFLTLLYGLGVITFLLGALGAYHILFETNDKSPYAVLGAIFAIIASLSLKAMTVSIGILVLSMLLSIVAIYGLLVMINYFKLTKAPWLLYPVMLIVIILFLFSAILPALANARLAMQEAPTSEDIAAFKELQLQTPQRAVLLTPIKEAAAIQYFSKRTTVTDQDFLLVPNGDELISDINSVYTSHFSSTVVQEAQKLGFTRVVLTRNAQLQYARDTLAVDDQTCLPSEDIENLVVYAVECRGAQ